LEGRYGEWEEAGQEEGRRGGRDRIFLLKEFAFIIFINI